MLDVLRTEYQRVLQQLTKLQPAEKQYLLVTGNYWAFTLTDGALRMLVVLYFHQLGYSPLSIAMLFLFYEFFGIVTNLFGGWLGARFGLNATMNLGLGLQIVALLMLTVSDSALTVAWVMSAQALSGIAKDLNKMSAKSSVKSLVGSGQENALFKWVAVLTGSKNALKGVGFFLGGVMLSIMGFRYSIIFMAICLFAVWCSSLKYLRKDLGKAKNKPKFTQIFSKSKSVNQLSLARLFLFCARDVWFVVALPVYLASEFDWDFWLVGSFMAIWVILYGLVQASAPRLISLQQSDQQYHQAFIWAAALSAIPLLMAVLLALGVSAYVVVIGGLLLFGGVFAINSALHSYLIVSYAEAEHVSMDVGFYYMANASGRLLGTLLSGALFQVSGLEVCLLMSTVLLSAAAWVSRKLP